METIGVIDYGMGNLHSLSKSLERVAGGRRVEVSPDIERLGKCDKLVLPGVGGARGCMDELKRLELVDFLRTAARRVPLLGVCLGMQMLLDRSEENGGVAALGLIPGDVVRFADPPPEPGTERLKVPHMGWNRVKQSRVHPLWNGIDDGSWYYFVHSFHAAPQSAAHTLGETEYTLNFTSVVARDNIVGVQFHPEKSQDSGLRLLANFAAWNGETP